jgi:predicted PurR-regulated permease PerM
MFRKLRNRLANFRLSMRMKLTLSLSAIAVVLMLSSIISMIEYRRMSNYVSELIADNINSINVAQQLTNVVDEYNLDILTVIGDETISTLPDFDQKAFVAYCDSLKVSMTEKKLLPLADSVLYSYSAYMLTSLELNDVLLSDFIDSRTWYFDRLQPVFGRLREDIDDLSLAIYNDLEKNSVAFDNGFYRSIIPSAVAVSVGILLVLLLLFFILAYYVKPIYKMLDSLDNYRSFNRKYNYTFEGDDELTDLNAGILELTEENSQMRRRLKEIKSKESGE